MTVETSPTEFPPGDGDVLLRGYHEVRGVLASKHMGQALHREWEAGSVLEGTVLQLSGDEHRERRRLENPLFRSDRLDLYEHHLLPGLLSSLLPRWINHGRADVFALAKLSTLSLSALTVGLDIDDGDLATLEELADYVDQVNQGLSLTYTLDDRDALKLRTRRAVESFDERFVAPALAKRAATQGPGDDLLGALVAAGAIETIDRHWLLHEASIFLEGGSYTSAVTATNAMHGLFSRFPASQLAQLASDVDLLQRAALEALRLNPIMPFSKRVALRDVTIGHRTYPAGTVVVLDNEAANLDGEVFGKDAAQFDPDRILEPGVQRSGIGFGGGPHACIGRVLAVGTPPSPIGEAAPPDHRYGMVPLVMSALLAAGARPDPDAPPAFEQGFRRRRFVRYPVLFTAGGNR